MNRAVVTPYHFVLRCVDSICGFVRFDLASGFLTLFLYLCLAGGAHAQNSLIYPPGAQQTVTLACNPFPPSKIASDAALPGYDVEVLRAAFASRNITLITPFYPWRRAYFLARTGKVDGLCSCSYLSEREEDFFYSYLLGHVRVAIYAIGNTALDTINEIKDAKNMTVGVVSGYSLEASARKAGLDVLLVNSETTLLHMLLSRRLDVALSYKAPMDYQMHAADHDITEINTIESKVISNNPYFSCISRNAKNPEALLKELNTGLAAIRENGLYDKILTKYGFFK
ncbi:transporter substrate-binding domain-containing protein [Thalassospira sp. HF15]|uniref:substrate-binding periplasmic protein n=1 Tax=Thalassospira sp. HF15 TaxID=2722755 RepID=UPI00142F4BE9|nr:transporter substrate-binding domain-containing protein [Thalassospira sp. HF15]NIY74741.1 transporter substrate-binding domain-containing protein [Thalassospira sp. HF15]